MTAFRYLIFGFFLSLLACRPTPIDPIVIEPKPVEWQSFQGLKGDNYSIVKFFATPQKLLIFGDNYLMEVDSAHRIVREEKFSERRITNYYGKIETNGAFFTHFDENTNYNFANKITVRSVASPQTKLEIDISQIDTNYRSVATGIYGTPGILTQDNRLFLPVAYGPKRYDVTDAVCRFLVYKIQMVGNTIQAIREPAYISVDLTVPGLSKTLFLSTLVLPKPTDNYFYFSAYASYRMDTRTGRYEQILDSYDTQFCYRNDTLWSFGSNVRNNAFTFAFLTPRQTDWVSFTSNVNRQSATWFPIEKQIIGLYASSYLALFTPQLDSNKFQIRTLADNNIPVIRDMVLFKDRVYLATTQGLVFKPFNDFIVFPKEK
jgi:hypothetical protein